MTLQRHLHTAGATRVCVDGAYVLSGGIDGVVALHPLKRWPSSTQLWARQCHEGAVTSVVLHSALALAISCGRDGNVVLHENVTAASTTSRVLCRVTGEVRCVLFDTERRRVFIAGDSLRCLEMASSGCSVRTVHMCVPHPLVALALSPCGRLVAMASASGAVGVVSFCGDEKLQSEDGLPEQRLRGVKIALPDLLPPMVKRDDAVAYRLCWCQSGAGSLLLFVPGVSHVRVMRFEGATSATTSSSVLRHVGDIDSFGITDLLGVTCYPLSAHVFCVVLAGVSGIVVAKVDERRWGLTRLQGQSFTDLTDACVNAGSGDVVVGTRDGVVTYLRREAPKALTKRKENDSNVLLGNCEKNGGGEEVKGQQKKVNGQANTGSELNGSGKANIKKNEQRDDNRNKNAPSNDCDNSSSGDDEFDDDGTEDGSYVSASSHASVVNEDFQKVVHDLKRSNPNYMDDDDNEERPSLWRQKDPKDVLRMVEKACHQRRSVFLDDEAEEDEETSDDDRGDSCSFAGGGVRDGKGHSRTDRHDVASVVALDTDGSAASLHALDEQPAFAAALGTSSVADYSFQIGATPLGEEGSCYLAYNSVGYIHSTSEGTMIHFHDMSIQAVRVLERGTILMGALSPVGAAFVLAQELDMDSVDDDTPRLTLYYRTFVAIGAQSDWRARLYPGETVRCLTVGIRYIAVATCRYLRLFSLSGLEIAVLSLFPRIVAMVGTNSSKIMHSFKADFDPLAVCYLEIGGQMRMQVLDIGSRTVVVPPVVVPLTLQQDGSFHQLQWMGWSEDGPLHVADTAGVLQMFTFNWGGSWIPVLDPRCLLDQTYNLWIWGVSDEAVLAYRSCKSDPPYPAAVASGLPTEHVRLFLPLTRCGTERDLVTWDHLLRREVRTDEVKRNSSFYTATIAKHDALHDKKIIDLFKNALKEHQTTRAFDLATFLELRDNIEICAKEANAQGHGQLVQKLILLLEMRVKTKKKRRCSLPLEGSVVSERERDLMLRKLLLKEKLSGSMNAAGNGGGDSMPQATERVETIKTENELSADKHVAVATQEPKPVPVKNVYVPTTESVSPSRRHVTFSEEVTVTPKKRLFETATTSASARSNGCEDGCGLQQQGPLASSAKPMNPFSRPAKKTMVTSFSGFTAQQQSVNGSSSSFFSTPTTLVLGDSQPSMTHLEDDGIGKERGVPLLQSQEQRQRTPQKPPVQTTMLSKPPTTSSTTGAGATATHVQITTATDGRVTPNTAGPANEPRRAASKLFCPRPLPVQHKAPLSVGATGVAPPAAVDPFLQHHDGASSLSLEGLLAGLGDSGSQSLDVPHSASFGAALRKRYREEEEEDEGGDGRRAIGVPVPRIDILRESN